jgi:hypothetical protein
MSVTRMPHLDHLDSQTSNECRHFYHSSSLNEACETLISHLVKHDKDNTRAVMVVLQQGNQF